jgi:assimilatory nitrate reductase catalytic subunit
MTLAAPLAPAAAKTSAKAKTPAKAIPNPLVVKTRTTCPYCAVQCSFDVEHLLLDNQALALRPTKACPVAKGSVCKKGLAALSEIRHAERLRSPLLRKNGQLVEVDWPEALDFIANQIKSLQQQHGQDAMAVFGGGSLTNEKVYLLGKFARVALATANIDYNGRFCMSSAAAGARQVYGLDRGLPFPLEKLAKKDCIVIFGANFAETLPPMSQYIARARKNGASIIMVDPRASKSSSLATHHLAVKPGGDLALALALTHVIFAEGRERWAFLDRFTSGWNSVAESLASYSPEWAEGECGIEAAKIRQIARLIARGGNGPAGVVVLSGRGPEQSERGVDTVRALCHLALAVGGLYAPLTGQGNGQGGREHGQKADQLPGYRSIDDPLARAHLADIWGIEADQLPGKGLSAQELLAACGKSVQGLLILGSNPLVSAPNVTQLEQDLKALQLLVVIDFYLSETAVLADVVLPGNMWLEEDGTMTNLEGRVLLRRKVLDVPEGVMEDWRILCALAARLGHGERFSYEEPRDLFSELALATKGGPADYSGISYRKLSERGSVFWPCPSHDHPGTPEPFKRGFAHPDGLAQMRPVVYRPPIERPDGEFPLALITGRLSEHYQSGSQTRRNPVLNNKAAEATLEIHPDTAAAYGLKGGDQVLVTTRRGEARLKLVVSQKIRPDTIFAPFHFAGAGAINRLTNPAFDPTSKMPEFKLAAAQVRALE